MSEPAAAPSIRPIVLLSAAAFASAATLRVADPLLPQIAGEFGTTAGGASVIATAFAVSYGLCQVFVGALGDRFGKYTVIAVATFLSGLTVAAGALADSLAWLGVLRLLSGATAGAIIPLAMAYLGDVVAYEHRQTVLARFLSGQIRFSDIAALNRRVLDAYTTHPVNNLDDLLEADLWARHQAHAALGRTQLRAVASA